MHWAENSSLSFSSVLITAGKIGCRNTIKPSSEPFNKSRAATLVKRDKDGIDKASPKLCQAILCKENDSFQYSL